jgi:hypothetical protein
LKQRDPECDTDQAILGYSICCDIIALSPHDDEAASVPYMQEKSPKGSAACTDLEASLEAVRNAVQNFLGSSRA